MRNILEKVGKGSKQIYTAFKETPLVAGISDIMVIKRNSNQYYSTPFMVCFGNDIFSVKEKKVKVYINNKQVNSDYFSIDNCGYLVPKDPKQQILKGFNLKQGVNSIKFELDTGFAISAEIHLYRESDKILISDMDGTMTKSDLRGLYNNYKNKDYLHEGYFDLLQTVKQKGYKIVWLTMRALSLYSFSKQYIKMQTSIEGVLITAPEQFFSAVKKQILKQTQDIKTSMLMSIKNLFPNSINPFIAGLGNRENDAIAYRNAGIPEQNIFLINKQSIVYNFSHHHSMTNYKEMSQNIDKYFWEGSSIKISKNQNQHVDKDNIECKTVKKSTSQHQQKQSGELFIFRNTMQ